MVYDLSLAVELLLTNTSFSHQLNISRALATLYLTLTSISGVYMPVSTTSVRPTPTRNTTISRELYSIRATTGQPSKMTSPLSLQAHQLLTMSILAQVVCRTPAILTPPERHVICPAGDLLHKPE